MKLGARVYRSKMEVVLEMKKKKKKKKKARITSKDKEDRISTLPDELLHKILSFLDIELAVQTSVLSKRWKLVWTTLPFLNCAVVGFSKNTEKIARHVLNNRNHQTHISSLKLRFLSIDLTAEFVNYAIAHHVQDLFVTFVDSYASYNLKLSDFSSVSIQKLELLILIEDTLSDSDCWDLPALTTLHLCNFLDAEIHRLEIYLNCLPALTTLSLTMFRLETLSFSLPHLTTLKLSSCYNLPSKVWNFPALQTLTLDDVVYPKNMSDMFAALVSLRNLSISFKSGPIQDFLISCPQLVNLEIKTRPHHIDKNLNSNIVVLAPKLSNLTSVGIFPIIIGASKLDTVHIKLENWYYREDGHTKSKGIYQAFAYMLPRLGNAKILHLDFEAIEALSLVSDFLGNFPSPFCNLKYVKLPHGYKETKISDTLRSYLIGGSLSAIIVTSLPQNIISHIAASSVTANVVPQKPLAARTKMLVDSENIHKTVGVDNVNLGVQEEHVVHNSVLVGDVRQIGAPVVRTDNDQAGHSMGNSDSGLWRGHEINSEFVYLLGEIMNKFPETFDHFTTKNKKVVTMKLNMLCTSVINFTKISMSEVDTEMIAEFRDVFASLQKFGFNVGWLVNRLNYIEQLRFSEPLVTEIHAIDCRINDAKTKLQDLQTLRAEKMQEIQKALGTLGTNLVVGCIGDDLLSGP